jgi:phage FluMu protein Com
MLLMTRAMDHERTLRLICESCGKVYTPADAQNITILGLGYARYACPECEHVVRSTPPNAGTTNGTAANGTAASDLTPAIIPLAQTKGERGV